MTQTDVVLIGAGIMSATLGTLLRLVEPDCSITLLERLDGVAAESSDPWHNAGTGHSALCELNYTPESADGSIDAACVGTTLSPEQVAEEEGFHVLAWVGDHIQIPTVGVAVDPVHIPLDSPALQALVRANNRALRTMAEQPDLVVDYIASFLNRLTHDEAQQYYERYIRSAFTPDGRVDLNIAQQGIDAVAAELGVAPVAADLIYAPSA